MKRRVLILCVVLPAIGLFSPSPAPAQQETAETRELRSGKNLIATPVYSAEEDKQLLDLFKPLRVADVIDGMDMVGLKGVGLMDQEIHPLWRDTQKFSHRIVGIAVTVRYVPSNKPANGPMEPAAFDDWVTKWYAEKSSEPFRPLVREGSVVVIDETPSNDVGSIGSNNILGIKRAGGVGVISNGTGVRDNDEIIAERIPVYFRKPGRGIRPGRNEVESVNRPIVVGGATVIPGDVVIADGDGVLVIPRAQAKAVGDYAQKVLTGDKASRRQQYEQMALPLDESVK